MWSRYNQEWISVRYEELMNHRLHCVFMLQGKLKKQTLEAGEGFLAPFHLLLRCTKEEEVQTPLTLVVYTTTWFSRVAELTIKLFYCTYYKCDSSCDLFEVKKKGLDWVKLFMEVEGDELQEPSSSLFLPRAVSLHGALWAMGWVGVKKKEKCTWFYSTVSILHGLAVSE